MKTDDLIAALAADTLPRLSVGQRLVRGIAVALPVSLVAFLILWGTRPDLAAALISAAVFKSLLPLVLAVLASGLALRLSRPEVQARNRAALLWVFGAGLLAGVGGAIADQGVAGLASSLATPSLATCLISIPLLALPFLWAVLWALGAGAARRPALSGAVGGLVAGGLAAAIYSLYCDQDAALFYLPAYSLAILCVASIGALAGSRTLAW